MIPDSEIIRLTIQFTDITHPQHPKTNLLLLSSFIHIKQFSFKFPFTIFIKFGV